MRARTTTCRSQSRRRHGSDPAARCGAPAASRGEQSLSRNQRRGSTVVTSIDQQGVAGWARGCDGRSFESTGLIQGGGNRKKWSRLTSPSSGTCRFAIPFNHCGALPESLLESELFGHVKGSFTGAVKDKAGLFTAAAGGTFFLDEIGETTPSTQVKLLRALQEREIIPVGATEAIQTDARVLAATNRELEEEMKRGGFRSDLFYRLNVFALHLPPLRHRKEDIPLLATSFLERTAKVRGEPLKRLSEDTLEIMREYQWPGNVRELENSLERAAILTTGEVIDPSSLPERITERRSEPIVAERGPTNPTLDVIERGLHHVGASERRRNKSARPKCSASTLRRFTESSHDSASRPDHDARPCRHSGSIPPRETSPFSRRPRSCSPSRVCGVHRNRRPSPMPRCG